MSSSVPHARLSVLQCSSSALGFIAACALPSRWWAPRGARSADPIDVRREAGRAFPQRRRARRRVRCVPSRGAQEEVCPARRPVSLHPAPSVPADPLVLLFCTSRFRRAQAVLIARLICRSCVGLFQSSLPAFPPSPFTPPSFCGNKSTVGVS